MQSTIKECFGLSVNINKISAPSGVPLYMTTGRSFYFAECFESKFLLIELKNDEKFGAVALSKQLAKYMQVCGMNAAYSIHTLTKRQRDALVNQRIPFLSLPNQIFLPFLGIAFNNRFRKQTELKLNCFAPATQCLYLYFLYHCDKENISKKAVAKELGLTPMSITRASAQLATMNLLKEETVGKEVLMAPIARGREYYELGKPYLINPVFKVITVKENDLLKSCPLAGESALSENSMLNPPTIPVRAIWRKDKSIECLEEVDVKWEQDCNAVAVEIWKYDPMLFSMAGAIDPVSLATSLAEENDERVQGELDDYMEGVKW